MTLPLFPVSLISVTVSLEKKRIKEEKKSISHSSFFTQLRLDHIAQALKSPHCSLTVCENQVQVCVALDGKINFYDISSVWALNANFFDQGFWSLNAISSESITMPFIVPPSYQIYSCTNCIATPLETEKDRIKKLGYFIFLHSENEINKFVRSLWTEG